MFLFKVKEGKIIFSSAEAEKRFNRLLLSYNNTGRTLLLNIDEYSKSVSSAQLELYKAIIIAGSEYTGSTYKEFEQELITQFAPIRYITDVLGNKSKERTPVSQMNRKEFQAFVENSVQFMNEFLGMNFKLYSDDIDNN